MMKLEISELLLQDLQMVCAAQAQHYLIDIIGDYANSFITKCNGKPGKIIITFELEEPDK